MIAILTDFGLKDPYIGIMKGVLYSINPSSTIIDIVHEIEAYNILKGAFYLANAYKFFPKNTVFLCIIDPGVGSQRLPIACYYKNYFFVGPMNGIFDLVFEEEPMCVDISNHPYILKPTSTTFHGKDIFAPAAAYIDKIKSIENFGSKINYEYNLNLLHPKQIGNIIEGEILFYDNFGNAITNVKCTNIKYALINNKKIKYYKFFAEAKAKTPGITCGSFGYLEFFINQGSFKDFYNVKNFKIIL